jgi:hypothetical protein
VHNTEFPAQSGIRSRHPSIYMDSWPYVYSVPTCAKFDLHRTCRNATTAYVGKCLYLCWDDARIWSKHFGFFNNKLLIYLNNIWWWLCLALITYTYERFEASTWYVDCISAQQIPTFVRDWYVGICQPRYKAWRQRRPQSSTYTQFSISVMTSFCSYQLQINTVRPLRKNEYHSYF